MQRVPGARAAQRLAGMEALDPRGLCAPGDIEAMCDGAQCFEVSGAIDAVYVLTVRNGVAWCEAIHGKSNARGLNVVDTLLAIATEQARGLQAIACQTPIRAQKRKLERLGFRVTGWILRKDL